MSEKEKMQGATIEPDPAEDQANELINNLALSEEAREKLEKAFKNIVGNNEKLLESLQSQQNQISKAFGSLVHIDGAQEVIKNILESMKPFQALFDEMEILEPYLIEELDKPEYDGKTYDYIMHNYTPRELLEMGEDPNSFFHKAMDAARAARGDALPVIDTHRTTKLNTPTDKINFFAWDDFKQTNGQLQLKFDTQSKKDKCAGRQDLDISVSMRFSLSFDDDPRIKTTKELNHFDRRVDQAIDTLFTSGHDILLIGDIYSAMGGKTSNKSKNQRDKIRNSLTKQGTGRIYINNEAEAEQYDYPKVIYDGNILTFERLRVIYKGRESEAIKILRRPILMEFADQRNQMTAIPLKVLQSGVSQTNNNLRIEDYLLDRIVHHKNSIQTLKKQQDKKYSQSRQAQLNKKRNFSIMLDTFYKRIGMDGKKGNEKKRALNTAKKYLDHYKSAEAGAWITSYSIRGDKIIITLPIE